MVCIRTDGNSEIGTGHVMRCLSIADALKKCGTEVSFILSDSNMEALINERGYNCLVLNTDYQKLSEEMEVLFEQELFKSAKTIIVDSYYADVEYIKAIKEKKPTAYIDDVFNAYPADVIINYNIYADKERYIKNYDAFEPSFLLGPKYAPLREQYVNCKTANIREKVGDILLMTGGSDSLHVALRCAKEILADQTGDYKYHIVVGAMSGDFEEIERLAALSDDRIVVYRNVKDMKSLMEKCDIAVSAAGSTLYELCACGVPTIDYVLADNQKEAADFFSREGIMEYAGDVREGEAFFGSLFCKIKELADDFEKRRMLSEKAQKTVDGRGAERIAEFLEG